MPSFERLAAKSLKLLGRQEILDSHEAVSVELVPPLGRHGGRKAPPTHTREFVCDPHAHGVKSCLIQPPGAEDRIIDKALRARRQR